MTTRFPDGFLWGAATASHQVEGDNTANDWWALEQARVLPHASGPACRHYTLFESDFDLARSLGHNAHRLSLEWSRIEPQEGRWDLGAVRHYVEVIAALRARGLEPVVTLHHFTNPQWFAARGGWVRADSVALFRRYAAFVASHFASRVRFWLTVNEPTVYVKRAYIMGSWPPCKRNAPFDAWRALRNMCRAHTAAYDELHRVRADAMVSFAHSAPYIAPAHPQRALDRFAAFTRNFILNDSVLHLLGRPARSALDFVALNYYTRELVSWKARGLALLVGAESATERDGTPRRLSTLGWEIYPQGLRFTLERFARLGLPLMVTENGIATTDEAERSAYLDSHVATLAQAVAAGLDVRGYLVWTLYDNFEWTEGYAPKFGLAALDRTTQRREPRPAAHAFARICRANRYPPGEAA